MRRVLVPFLLSVSVLGAVLWLITRSRDQFPGRGGSHDESAAGVGNPEGLVSSDPAAGRAKGASAPDSSAAADSTAGSVAPPELGEATALLEGKVTDPLDHPIPGARILVQGGVELALASDLERLELARERALGKVKSSPSRVVARAVTDGSGEYRIAVAGLARRRYQVSARGDGFAPLAKEWGWTPGTSRLDFQLEHGQWIAGVVLDPQGRPVPAARVEATQDGRSGRFFPLPFREVVDQTETGDDGRFLLNVFPGEFEVSGDAEGLAATTIEDVPAGADGVELALSPARNLLVRVKDQEGKPVAGAEVELALGSPWGRGFGRGGPGRGGPGFGGRGPGEGFRPPAVMRRILAAPEARAETGPGGEVRFEELPAGPYTLAVSRRGYVGREEDGELPAERTTHEVELRLEPGRRLEGTVTGPDGEPVAGAFVAVGQPFVPWWEGRPGGDRGRGPRGGPPGAPPGGPETAEDRARRERFERFVEERRREPIAVYRAAAVAETDGAGRFLFDSLEKRKYTLSVESDEYVPYRVEEVDLEESDQSLAVKLERGLVLEGRVLSAVTEEPVAGAAVILGRREYRKAERSAEDGRYRFAGLTPGDAGSLRVEAPGYSLALVDDLQLGGESPVETLDVRLDPAGTIRGVVVDARGEPVPRARVTVVPREEEEGGGDEERGGWRGVRSRWRQYLRASAARSDTAGRFELVQVNPGPSLELRVEHPAYRELRSEPFRLEPGEVLEGLELRLSTGAGILVTVLAASGEPAAGARVTLERIREEGERDEGRERRRGGPRGPWDRGRGGDRQFRSANAAGQVLFAGLDAGEYAVATAADRHQPHHARATLVEDERSELAVELLPENWIAGVVVDSSGNPIPGVALRARRDLDEGRREESFARSAPDGSFRIGRLGAGPYELRADARGYASARLAEVEVQRSDVRIEMQRLGSVSGWVVALETGVPVTAFELRLAERRETPGEDAEDEEGGPREAAPWWGRGRGGGRGPNRFEDPAGQFLLEGVRPGEYLLEAAAARFTGTRVPVTVREGEAVEGVTVELEEGLSVYGVAVDARNGEPVEGARVYLVRLGDLEEGSGDDQGERRSPQERIEERRRLLQERLEERRSASGRGRREGPRESAKLALSLLGSARRGGGGLATDAEGFFKVPEVTPARYGLVVEHDAYVPYGTEVILSETRALREVRVRLERGEVLRGTVTLARQGVPGVVLFLRGQNGLEKRGQAGGGGRYEFSGLLPGQYTLLARLEDGSRGQALQVTVKSGRNEQDYEIMEEAARAVPQPGDRARR